MALNASSKRARQHVKKAKQSAQYLVRMANFSAQRVPVAKSRAHARAQDLVGTVFKKAALLYQTQQTADPAEYPS